MTGSERYPVSGRPLTDAGLPDDIDHFDAAFVWGHNRRAYVISGSMYWKLVAEPDRTLVESHTYPRDMSMWAGVPIPVDGALTYNNGLLLATIPCHVAVIMGRITGARPSVCLCLCVTYGFLT